MRRIKPIRSEADYDAAVARIGELMDAAPNTPDGDELDVLSDLALLYERDNILRELPDASSAIRFRIEQMGLTERDLARILGDATAASDALSGKLVITMPLARALHTELGVPASVLIRDAGVGVPSTPATSAEAVSAAR